MVPGEGQPWDIADEYLVIRGEGSVDMGEGPTVDVLKEAECGGATDDARAGLAEAEGEDEHKPEALGAAGVHRRERRREEGRGC